MMKFKKILAAAMTSAMILGLVATAAPAVSAYAAGSAPTAEPVDYEKFEVEVTSSDEVVFLEVLKENDAESKVSATYSFPVSSGKATIDLSFLKATKEQYIRFYDTKGRSAIVTIAAQPAKFAVKFTSKGTVAESFAGKGFDATKLATYQYRSLYASTWQSMDGLSDAKLQSYTVTGMTLILRVAPVKASSLASAEVKVKIPAAAKAPKVKIDYAKAMITVGKGVEYTLDPSAASWTAIKDTKLSVADFRKGLGKSGTDNVTCYVRTAATNKKVASNMVMITIPADAAFASSAKFTEDTSTKALSGSIAMDGAATETITAKTIVDKDDPSVAEVEFKAAGASFDFSTDGGRTWKTVKAGKTFTVDQTKGSTLTVRRSGDKTKETLPSATMEITINAYVKPTT